jgi:hypothetical protein
MFFCCDMAFKRVALSLAAFYPRDQHFRQSSTYLMIASRKIIADHMDLRLARLPIPRQASLPPEEGYITR